jgi:hypothetical protein
MGQSHSSHDGRAPVVLNSLASDGIRNAVVVANDQQVILNMTTLLHADILQSFVGKLRRSNHSSALTLSYSSSVPITYTSSLP